jgi:mRNA interferase RelE/StbE
MSEWTLSITFKAQNDIRNLDNKIIKQIIDKLSWLEKNFDSIIPIRLVGNMSEYNKLRLGDYRIIYGFNFRRKIIHIYRIGHRSKIYKN